MKKKSLWILIIVLLILLSVFFLERENSDNVSRNEAFINEIIATGNAIADFENSSVEGYPEEADCGEDYCGKWKGYYCNGKGVWKNRICYNISESDGECYNNSYEEEWLAEECRYSCFKGKCVTGGGGGGSGSAESVPSETADTEYVDSGYFLHENITVTTFWVGEEAGEDNGFISNEQSAWDDRWMEHYGGVDNPDSREGYYPSGFVPLENPFYFALPYNDFEDGERKENAESVIYWASDKEYQEFESMCKNRWIKITKGNKTAYAQWQDVGPFGENDYEYVFGEALPENEENENAGLDVSPAVKDFLNLSGMDKVSWQFVNYSEVEDGPWKDIITVSQISWGE